ncbi:MAG: hypothetical protein ACYC8T_11750 [Myxococcaceae bacterium]
MSLLLLAALGGCRSNAPQPCGEILTEAQLERIFGIAPSTSRDSSYRSRCQRTWEFGSAPVVVELNRLDDAASLLERATRRNGTIEAAQGLPGVWFVRGVTPSPGAPSEIWVIVARPAGSIRFELRSNFDMTLAYSMVDALNLARADAFLAQR